MATAPSHLKKRLRGLIAGALLLALPFPAYAQDIGTGLISHWRLDETSGSTITDSVGNNDGTWEDGAGNDVAEETTAGQIGTALVFDGGASFVGIANPTSFNMGTADFTVSAWVKRDGSGGNGEASILAKDDFGSWEAQGKKIYLAEDGETRKITFDAFGIGTIYSTTSVDDEWHHIAVSFNDATNGVTFYLDGVADGTGTLALTGDNAGHSLSMQGGTSVTLDDVRFYNRVLTAADVAELYTKTTSGSIRYNEKSEAIEYHDGTQWVHTGLGSYSPNAVSFDGTNDYLNTGADLNNLGDCKKWSGSVWFRRSSDTGTSEFFYDGAGTSNYVSIADTDDTIRVIGRDSGSTTILDIRSSTSITDTNWHHLMWSVDLTDTSRRYLYLDGTSDIDVQTYTNALLDNTQTDHFIGTGGGVNYFDGDIADLWMSFCTYVDLSDAANRARFISANGMPMYLGHDGSLPLGFAPDIYMTGATDDWHTNKGTGGGFTENGALTDAASQPGDNAAGMTWAQVGSNLYIGSSQFPSITALDSNTVAHTDTTNDLLRTYSWNGATWSLVGSAFTLPAVTEPWITALDSTTVAFIDSTNNQLRTYSWDGANWSQVGNSLAIASNSDAAITALDSTTIAFLDEGNQDLRTYSWDGTDWSQIGSDLNIVNAFDPSLAKIDENTIALYATSVVSEIRTYSWNGSTWSQVGNGLPASVDQASMTSTSPNTIAFFSFGEKLLKRYKWDGTDWTQIGVSLAIADSYPNLTSIARLDNDTIAFIEGSVQRLTTYKFSDVTPCATPTTQPGSIIYNTDDKVMQYCNGTEYVAMGPIGGTGGGGCVNPVGAAGDIIFNKAHAVIQYCNAEDWVAVGQGTGLPSDSGLLHHWKLDETSGSVITDYAGSLNGAWDDNANFDVAEETTTGVFGNALTFDGSNNEIQTAASFSIPQTATISMWVKFNSLTGTQRFFGSDDNFEIMKNSSNNIDSDILESSGTAPTSTAVKTGTWYHIAVAYDGTADISNIYINGVLDTTGGATGTPTSPDALGLGERDGSAQKLDGLLDDVRIYGKMLTAEQIAALYSAGNIAAPAAPTTNLVAHYKMNEETGAVISDSSGNGFDGTWVDNVNDDVAEETVAGKDSTALSFDGVSGGGGDDYIDLGTTDILTGREAAFSICSWVKLDTLTTAEYIIYSRWGGAVSGAFLFQADSNSRWGIETGTGGFNNMYATTRLTAGVWTHLCAVRSAGTLYFYKDGISDGSVAYTQPNSIVGADQAITAGNAGLALDGTLDDIRIYNVALTATEVTNLYLATGGS